jgi:addiction module HigA family antidote
VNGTSNCRKAGTVLRDYLGKMQVVDAAKHLDISRVTLSRVLNGSASLSADMAIRLSEALGTSLDLWAGMQSQYDLWQATKKRRKKIRRLVVAA